ncbi:hypothetical protein V6N11_038572 [Hibiscus sabdariffa]|uniref:Metallothionein-like protein type 3 n=1 Tax=Hibiscus sabdariffa TaxID=183260 RepID=A0ABR2SLB5_9ROSI
MDTRGGEPASPNARPCFKTIAIPSQSSLSETINKTLSNFTMSGMCGNCDCADKSQCVKKGNTMVIETEKSYISTVVTDDVIFGTLENGCKCGANCSCTTCTCGH